jgi:hypothetical protein
MRWVLKNDGRRSSLLERSFALYLRRLWFKQDECYTTESVVGAIVWELPGQWKAGVFDQVRLLPSMAWINGRLLPRILRALAALESNHPAEPHYYLPLVGAIRSGRAVGWAPCSCARSWTAATTRRCRPTWRRPRPATARSTSVTASR